MSLVQVQSWEASDREASAREASARHWAPVFFNYFFHFLFYFFANFTPGSERSEDKHYH